jgi:hypothetical protein
MAERCLAHLAALDWPAAVEIARAWSTMELPEGAQPIVAALLNFPAVGALEAFLDSLGLTDQLHLDLAEHEERPVTLQEVLLHRGRAHLFSLKRRQDCVRHDVLMRELASLAAGALDGLHLEQVPRAEEQLGDENLEGGLDGEQEDEDDFGEYAAAEQLVARGGGKRYEAPAKGEVSVDEDDDYIDAYALLDFLNALAQARARGERWVLFDTDGEACVVVAGPRPALEALQARGLIPVSAHFSSANARRRGLRDAETLKQPAEECNDASRAIRLVEFSPAEAKNRVSGQLKLAISRNHLRVLGWARAFPIGVVLFAVDLNDDPVSRGQEEKKVHSLPSQELRIRSPDERIQVQVDPRNEGGRSPLHVPHKLTQIGAE